MPETDYFFIRQTGGDSKSNLQLFSLIQAERYWLKAQEIYGKNEKDTPKLIEYYAFIISCIGLSLTQLLGQNYSGQNKRIPSPVDLFKHVLENAKNMPEKAYKDLDAAFKDLIETYDKCRHFGVAEGGKPHRIVAQLTLMKTSAYMQTTYKVWDAVIAVFAANPKSELGEIKEIGVKQMVKEIIEFGDHTFAPEF